MSETESCRHEMFPHKLQLQAGGAVNATLFHNCQEFKVALKHRSNKRTILPRMLCGHKPQQISKDANMTHKVETNTCWFT